MSVKPYPSYKASGVEWVGDIPSGWMNLPFFTVVRERREKNHALEEENLLSLSYGRIVRKDISSNEGLLPESFSTYQVVQPADMVFRLTDLQNDKRSLRSAIVEERGIITSAYLAVEPIGHVPRYLAYLMRAYDNQKVFYSMGGGLRQSMKFDDVKHLPVITPSIDEQQQIADYLDAQTAKIDLLIEKQEQLIATLAERRQAVISHAVTKGLDPTAPLKDSGVEWLGRVPESWPVVKVGYAYSVTVGKMLNGTKSTEGGTATPYVRAANIQPDGLDLREAKQMVVSIAEKRALDLRRDDVVVVEGGGGYGRSDVLKSDLPGWVFQNHVLRVRPRGQSSSDFFNYLMKTINSNGHVASLSNHATIPSISSEKLASVRFGLPPIEEQAKIVAHLDCETAQIDALSAKARQMIDILKERRQALISAAVTGKIDVRGLS